MNPQDRLLKAIKKSDTASVTDLLEDEEININQLDHKSGKTFTQIAMESGDSDIFNILLRFPQFDPHVLNKNGESLLQVAIMMNDCLYVAKLLEKNPNMKKKNFQGQTALQVAIKNKINPQIIKKFIHYGFDINENLPDVGSLLHLAIISNQADNFICLLAEKNVNMRSVDDEDNTCLILAVKMNKADIIMSILEKLKENQMTEMEKQFFINSQDCEGNTAIHIAYLKDLQTISSILEKEGKRYGIDLSIKNKQGKTCQIIAQDRQKERELEKINESKRREEKIMKKKEKEEEKVRMIKQQERLRKEEKQKKKVQEKLMKAQLIEKQQTQKKKILWGTGIIFIAVVGIMYLMILNSIETNKSNAI